MSTNPEVEDFLEHFGVRGMHWGVRHAPIPGVSRRVHKMAAKDAQEHARAKLFYGEGAGNRRKLIKAKVEYNSKHVPGYSKAFAAEVSAQNLADHATKATKERHSIDRKDRNKKRAGAVARRITGEWGTQAAFVALAAGGVAFARSDRGRRVMNRGVSTIRNAQSEFTRRQGARRISSLLKNMK